MSVVSHRSLHTGGAPGAEPQGEAAADPGGAGSGHVTAVLVSHDGAAWLPRVLAAVAAQDRPPDTWVAVDTGSSDGSVRMLTDVLGAEAVIEVGAETPFASAVAQGLRHRPPVDGGWIWLLHDDSAPGPAALGALLSEARSAPDVAAVGPKTREWPSLRRLLEVGVTVSGSGGRETGLEPGEPDQGQHDRPRDALAAGTAGLLLRAEVWDLLGGLDPHAGLADDLDLGWRIARSGRRVRVAPAAVVFHVEAAARDRRSAGALTGSARYQGRRGALFVLLANCRAAVLPVQLVRLLAGSLLRALGLLLLKAPREALDELRAVVAVYAGPVTLWRARQDRRRTATVPPGRVRHLLPPAWAPYRTGVAVVTDTVAGLLGSRPSRGGRASTESGPVPAEAEALDAGPGHVARLGRRPLAVAALLLLGLTLLAMRALLTGGELQGGALLPAPDGVATWWTAYLASWHPVGVGSTAGAPAYTLLLAALGLLTLGDAGLLVSLLLVLAVPVSALTASLLLRRLGVAQLPRLWGAVAYAGLPLVTGALAQGRLGTVLATAWLPLVVVAVLSLAAVQPVGLWARRVRAGLALGVLVALVPAAYPLALALTVATTLLAALAGPRGTGPRRTRSVAVSAVVVLGLPWLVAPWWLADRVRHPQTWWWEAGLADAGVGALSPGVAELALGQPGGPGGPVVVGWLGAGVLLVAALALLHAGTRAVTGAAWCVAAAGLALAALGAGRTVDLDGQQVPVWVGFCLVVWWGGLLTAAAVAAGGLLERSSGPGPWRRLLTPAVVVAALCPLVALAVHAAAGLDGPLHRSPAAPLPIYLVDDARAGAHVSTLLVAGAIPTGLSLTVEREDGWRLGEEPFGGAAGAEPVSAAVRDLLVSPQARSGRTLARWGIGYLYAAGPVDPAVTTALDSAPGLVRSGAPSGDAAWRLQVAPRQLQVAQTTGRVGTEPPPTAGDGDPRRWQVAAQLTGLGIALVLAAPGRHRRPT